MKRLRLERGFLALMAAVVVFVAVCAAMAWRYTLLVNTEGCRYIDEDWTYTAADGTTQALRLPAVWRLSRRLWGACPIV